MANVANLTSAEQAVQDGAEVDVLIVGAGLSGVGAAYWIQTRCPAKSYAIVEARDRMGGTWDLFQYPGIRSDSDMYTLGYSFRPWTSPKAIADGAAILDYIKDTAREHHIDEKIAYQRKVERAAWSTDAARWTVDLRDTATNELHRIRCRFLYVCAGYYDYDGGYTPDYSGVEQFKGEIIHPQKWTRAVDYANKQVVVIGSGATAVTLVPELARKAAHVTMLQRSPTYIVSVPAKDRIADVLRSVLPSEQAYAATRWKNVVFGLGFYAFCRRFPKQAKRFLVKQVERQLKDVSDVAHFTPSYDPWDQRVCLVPDSDLFEALHSGKASVVTAHIETFTETGIRLKDGAEIRADLVVSATGLNVKFLGGAKLEVDGIPFEPSRTMIYKGMMCSDVPNLAFALGYTNASWTLKCDLASQYVCRLINYMDGHGYAQCVPRRDPLVEEEPLLDFTSGYIERARAWLPRQGSIAPWKLHQNYARDRWLFARGRLDDSAMEFARPR